MNKPESKPYYSFNECLRYIIEKYGVDIDQDIEMIPMEYWTIREWLEEEWLRDYYVEFHFLLRDDDWKDLWHKDFVRLIGLFVSEFGEEAEYLTQYSKLYD